MMGTRKKDDGSLVGKLTLAMMVVKGLRGLVKLGALAGAAALGWIAGERAVQAATDRFQD